MICYICEGKGEEKKASFQCPNCKRFVCGKHTELAYDDPCDYYLANASRSYYCSNCAQIKNAAFGQKQEEARQQNIEEHTCDFCGRVDLREPEVHRCGKCGKRFCTKCGWRKFKGYRLTDDGWEGYIKVAVIEDRCNKHAGSLWRIGASRRLPPDV